MTETLPDLQTPDWTMPTSYLMQNRKNGPLHDPAHIKHIQLTAPFVLSSFSLFLFFSLFACFEYLGTYGSYRASFSVILFVQISCTKMVQQNNMKQYQTEIFADSNSRPHHCESPDLTTRPCKPFYLRNRVLPLCYSS